MTKHDIYNLIINALKKENLETHIIKEGILVPTLKKNYVIKVVKKRKFKKEANL